MSRFRAITPDEVRETLVEFGALWQYSGQPDAKKEHALLTSGNHSDGFVIVGEVLKQHSEVLSEFGDGLLALLGEYWDQRIITHVVGADTSSTALAEYVAWQIGARHICMVKTTTSEGNEQVWGPGNEPLGERAVILQVEELITTSSSALMVREGIRRANPNSPFSYVPYLPVIVDRSDPDRRVTVIGESQVQFLLHLEIRNYPPDSCPYCKVGSRAIKPKEAGNWRRLMDQHRLATTLGLAAPIKSRFFYSPPHKTILTRI